MTVVGLEALGIEFYYLRFFFLGDTLGERIWFEFKTSGPVSSASTTDLLSCHF